MKQDIWGSSYHCQSTEDQPLHFYCPQGLKSHCFWQKAKAQIAVEEEEKERKIKEKAEELGETSGEAFSFYGKKKKEKSKVKTPMPSHKHMKVSFSLPPEDMKKVEAVYKRLTANDLLKRCLKGKTQNPNESFHQRVWIYCPKVKNVSRTVLEFAVATACIYYNIGYEYGYLGKELGIENNVMKNVLRKMDVERERYRHPQRRKKRKITVDAHYAAGEF